MTVNVCSMRFAGRPESRISARYLVSTSLQCTCGARKVIPSSVARRRTFGIGGPPFASLIVAGSARLLRDITANRVGHAAQHVADSRTGMNERSRQDSE